eukprot:3943884-Pleurochrysis_carterae.AAC.1
MPRHERVCCFWLALNAVHGRCCRHARSFVLLGCAGLGESPRGGCGEGGKRQARAQQLGLAWDAVDV